MRRFFLTLTVLSVPCCSQLPAQQPAQPPIVVKVEMPPANPWQPIIPGFIGMASALIAVWLTNKHNRRLTDENHKYEIDRYHRQEQLQLMKDFWFGLVTAVADFRSYLNRYAGYLIATKEQPLTDELQSQSKAHRDAIERLKHTLSHAISIGVIFLSEDHFAELENLNSIALRLMGEVQNNQELIAPSYRDFEDQFTRIVKFAKTDLDYKMTDSGIERQ
jgi:hypothetical protein